MKLLVVNPNISESVTDLIHAEAQRSVSPGTTLTMATAPFGVAYIETRFEALVGGYATACVVAEHQGQFDGVVVAAFGDPGLAGIKELCNVPVVGITTLEVMPIAEFNGRFGWGYDGVDLFAPTRLYGTPDDVKHFVDTAHALGLAVERVLQVSSGRQRHVVIVSRDRPDIFARLTRDFAHNRSVEVVLDRRVRDEFERARRYSLHFSLVLLDIDRLRDVNEKLGQEGGDRVLAEIGTLLQREIRAPDFVSRYGGDEFALLLPETDATQARRVIGHVLALLRERTRELTGAGKGQRVTFSTGVVTFAVSPASPDTALALADACMYGVKQGGKDGVSYREWP